jgi:hypothetical protein
MDNAIDDVFIPTYFTELWMPISKTAAVMNTLRDFFRQHGLDATGKYAFEIYANKNSVFWMSPSYGEEPVVRIDVFWFGYSAGDPSVVFFPKFWNLLQAFDFRLHWGKYLPSDPLPEKRWAKYFKERYPRWDDFLRIRATMDPRNIFLTSYWREHLGLEQQLAPTVVTSARHLEVESPPPI